MNFPESMPEYTDKFATVRGLRLHYVDFGGNGDTVLALHGLLQNAHAFDGIAPLLVPQMHLIALDLPGRGGSDWAAPDRYRIMQYLLDLRFFLNALGLRRLGLIGTSLGGWLARMYAVSHPERVTRLVLNDCAPGSDVAATSEMLMRMCHPSIEFTDLDEAIETFVAQREGLGSLDDGALKAWVSHYLVPTETGGLCLHFDPQILRLAQTRSKRLALETFCMQLAECNSAQTESLAYNYDAYAWNQLRRLSMPVLILRGERSKVIPRSAVARFTRILPNASWVEVPAAGHSPTLYEPVARDALKKFFATPI